MKKNRKCLACIVIMRIVARIVLDQWQMQELSQDILQQNFGEHCIFDELAKLAAFSIDKVEARIRLPRRRRYGNTVNASAGTKIYMMYMPVNFLKRVMPGNILRIVPEECDFKQHALSGKRAGETVLYCLFGKFAVQGCNGKNGRSFQFPCMTDGWFSSGNYPVFRWTISTKR